MELDIGYIEGGYTCGGGNCTYDWYLGLDETDCKLPDKDGALDHLEEPASLSIGMSSAFDEGTNSGTLTVTVSLDEDITPSRGTFNGITVLLYERNVRAGKYEFVQLVRQQLFFAAVSAVSPGEQSTFTVPFTLNAAWEADQVGALAFVQNYVGDPGDDPNDLMAYEIYNSGFLQNVNVSAPPPDTGHTRPVTRP